MEEVATLMETLLTCFSLVELIISLACNLCNRNQQKQSTLCLFTSYLLEMQKTYSSEPMGGKVKRWKMQEDAFPTWWEPGSIIKKIEHYIMFCNKKSTKKRNTDITVHKEIHRAETRFFGHLNFKVLDVMNYSIGQWRDYSWNIPVTNRTCSKPNFNPLQWNSQFFTL